MKILMYACWLFRPYSIRNWNGHVSEPPLAQPPPYHTSSLPMYDSAPLPGPPRNPMALSTAVVNIPNGPLQLQSVAPSQRSWHWPDSSGPTRKTNRWAMVRRKWKLSKSGLRQPMSSVMSYVMMRTLRICSQIRSNDLWDLRKVPAELAVSELRTPLHEERSRVFNRSLQLGLQSSSSLHVVINFTHAWVPCGY